MAHRTKPVYWQCLLQEYNKWEGKRWLIWSGHPDDEDSQILFDFEDKDYRKFFKGLPLFKDGALLAGRLTFDKAKAPKRGKLRKHIQEDIEAEKNAGSKP